MNDQLHFWVAVVVFSLMGIGLAVTALEFRREHIKSDEKGDR